MSESPASNAYSATVTDFDRGSSGLLEFVVDRHITEKPGAEYIVAVIAWWLHRKFIKSTEDLEWELMKCVPYYPYPIAESTDNEGFFMVSEGESAGGAELVHQDPTSLLYYIYGELDGEEAMGTVQLLGDTVQE